MPCITLPDLTARYEPSEPLFDLWVFTSLSCNMYRNLPLGVPLVTT
jgi:hypothetical protein